MQKNMLGVIKNGVKTQFAFHWGIKQLVSGNVTATSLMVKL